jgi:hypothetical protein
MDGQRLDRLSRLLASGPSRRAVLAGVGALLTHRSLPVPPVAAETGLVVTEAFGLCRLPGFPCGSDSPCCAGCQSDGTCGCRRRGKRAWLPVLCCSGKKKKGNKGKCR